MFRSSVERRLTRVADQLRRERSELAVVDEQLAHLAGEADDARLRALVSETPLAGREAFSASRHAEAMRSRRDELARNIDRLEQRQDELLDEMTRAER